MSTMSRDGHLATIEPDAKAGVLHGRVVNSRAVLTFEGASVDDSKRAFANTIADYKDWCRKRGVASGGQPASAS